jgi:DNA-binding Lrp family transcriptional regulator
MPKKTTRYQKEMEANEKRRNLIMKLYADGKGYRKAEIARMMGMSRSRVGAIIKEVNEKNGTEGGR